MITACAVVNCGGDVYDKQGQIIAGARLPSGEFANCQNFLLSGQNETALSPSNTTLAAVFMNAAFSKIELKRIAKMASTGMARAILPVFTRYDGDVVFCFSRGDQVVSEIAAGVMAAEAVRMAIVNAVTPVL